MLREHPTILRALVERHVAIPRDSIVKILDATVSPANAATVRAVDLALVITNAAGKALFVLLVEVQLARDPEKLFAWPLYVAHHAARERLPCVLVVVAFDAAVVRWIKSADFSRGSLVLRPFVVAADEVPRIDTPEAARKAPELALLSLFANLGAPIDVVGPIALAFFDAVAGLDPDRRIYYSDVAHATIAKKAPRLGEFLMQPPPNYRVQSPILREAEARGEARGEARLLGRLLELRFGVLAAPLRQRLEAASTEELDRWGERVLTADSLQAVFGDVER